MICKGRIVKSKAGHDREDFFVVIATLGEFAMIADGKHRKLQNPKKKKQKASGSYQGAGGCKRNYH